MPDNTTPYKEIPLTRGFVALVDAADYERVAAIKWSASRNWDMWNARGSVNGKTVMMHRYLLGLSPDDPTVDHRNGNALDNRRANLRMATALQNNANQGPRRTNSSGYKGVTRYEGPRYGAKQWRAVVNRYYVGFFATAEEAARACDAKALELHGEFAWLNFPPDGWVQNRLRQGESK